MSSETLWEGYHVARSGSVQVTALDHLVLTVTSIANTIHFYTHILGMRAEEFQAADGTSRHALKFGVQKINLHEVGSEFDPKAKAPTSGSADLCFLTDTPIEQWQSHLNACDVPILEGPIKRTGATCPILSVYVRDPDGNLIEISVPV
ncbi:MAG: VOC family protein [Paracoccaceae bacterium]